MQLWDTDSTTDAETSRVVPSFWKPANNFSLARTSEKDCCFTRSLLNMVMEHRLPPVRLKAKPPQPREVTFWKLCKLCDHRKRRNLSAPQNVGNECVQRTPHSTSLWGDGPIVFLPNLMWPVERCLANFSYILPFSVFSPSTPALSFAFWVPF